MRAAVATLVAAALLLAGCDQKVRKPPAPRPLPVATPGGAGAHPGTHDGATAPPAFFAGPPDGKLHVYFFDVGQADAALVISPTGTTALIDTGSTRTATHLVHRLPELLREAPDFLVVTDPAPEHAGGAAAVLAAIGAKRFLDPALPSPSPDYQALLASVEARQILHLTPAPDPRAPELALHYDLGGGATLEVFWPRVPVEQPLAAKDDFPDANALVLRVSYGETSVFFASDMTEQTERYLLQKRYPFRSTLLKVAEHGAQGASTREFLEAVSPAAAIVTVGAGPKKGLPSAHALERLEALHTRIFRSDLDGEVQAVSDGNAFTVTTERPVAGEAPGTPHVFKDRIDASLAAAREAIYHPKADPHEARLDPAKLPRGVHFVASRNSKVFHKPSCRNARRIKLDNLITFKTRSQAARRLKPASDCHP